jgi:hypothetical protein
MRRGTAGLLAILAIALVAPVAGGHYKTGDPDDPESEWYFRGQTWDGDEPKDPVNFIFIGGPLDGSDYERERIEEHMVDDWDTRAVGGRRWRRDSNIVNFCKSGHDMKWAHHPGETKDKSDYHGNTNRFCGNQHHARFWDDLEHERDTNHGRRHQWVVGGIHHEKVIIKWCKPPPTIPELPPFICGVKHKPDRDWDRVRMDMVRAMRKHCSVPRWRFHIGAKQEFQNYDNSGYIARFSLHHADDGGCEGW